MAAPVAVVWESPPPAPPWVRDCRPVAFSPPSRFADAYRCSICYEQHTNAEWYDMEGQWMCGVCFCTGQSEWVNRLHACYGSARIACANERRTTERLRQELATLRASNAHLQGELASKNVYISNLQTSNETLERRIRRLPEAVWQNTRDPGMLSWGIPLFEHLNISERPPHMRL